VRTEAVRLAARSTKLPLRNVKTEFVVDTVGPCVFPR
jgi:hypothetical protein